MSAKCLPVFVNLRDLYILQIIPMFKPAAEQLIEQVKCTKTPTFEGLLLGGRPDSNRRPPEPQSGVLTN